jgi:D-alanyl-lipoteichoic acid acyltransferase DltB (MBOAT superfamily)
MDALLRWLADPSLYFTSGVFAVLFATFYVLYAAASIPIFRAVLCLAASLGFYFHFAGRWVFLPVVVALIDYTAGRVLAALHSPTKRKIALWMAVGLDLSLLIYFKYVGFLGQIFSFRSAGEILAPVGLSFFIFKSLSYVFDVYYERLEKPERHLLYYVHYVSFFPAILAGPIHRAEEFLLRAREKIVLNGADIARYAGLFMLGLIKKTAIADVLAVNLVSRVFQAPELYSGVENLSAVLIYGFYLFNDFSGYSDMATALAGMLGYRLTPNFNEPFKSASVSEFWRRWHISLSQWFGDYVFMPLSFAWKEAGKWGAAAAALTTFALSGLWHGPSWTFVCWGTAHGLAVGIETLLAQRRRKWNKNALYRALSYPVTFIFLLATYPLFAAPTLSAAVVVYQKIVFDFSFDMWLSWYAAYAPVVPPAVAAVVLHFIPSAVKRRLFEWIERLPWPVVAVGAAAVVVAVWQVRSADAVPFVYLKF